MLTQTLGLQVLILFYHLFTTWPLGSSIVLAHFLLIVLIV